MQARLKVIQENANLKQVKLLPVTVIGRAAECQLKIASTQVSRRHCRITVTDSEVLIEDLNSANGTYLNQEKLAPGLPTVVPPGTTLHIGPAAFVVDYTPPLTLETMPTTVIKSSELPFLNGLTVKNPPMVDATVANAPVAIDQITEMVPPKLPVVESVDPNTSAKTAQPLPTELPPLDCPALEQQVSTRDPAKAVPVATPAVTAMLRGTERKTVVFDDLPIAKPVAESPKAFVAPPKPGVVGQSPVAKPISPVTKGPADPDFDFLPQSTGGASPPDLSGLDLHASQVSPNAADAKLAEPSPKPAANKKSLFGLFGKREKPSDTLAPETPMNSAAQETTAIAPSSTFGFFDASETDTGPDTAESIPAAQTAPQSEVAPADDPFAFLK